MGKVLELHSSVRPMVHPSPCTHPRATRLLGRGIRRLQVSVQLVQDEIHLVPCQLQAGVDVGDKR